MFAKLIAILIGMAAMTYCQDHHHHHHTTSHQSVVTHEIPKKVEHHYQEQKAIPVAHHTHAIHGHAGHIHATHTNVQGAPKLFIPVHEVVQEVAPSPVKHVAIQAPVHRAPIQIPVQHVPIQIPVQHVPIQIPVQHVPVSIPVHHVTVQVPVQHHVAQASHHEEAHKESHHEESHHGDHHDEHIDYYAHPKYEYEYKVEDPHTGDKKYQHETRDGDVVKGVYSLHEPDGSIRTVNYSSDKKSGFNADIVHKGHSTHEYHYHH